MSEKVIAVINGLGHSDQRIVLAHMLELSLTEKHLQTELIDRGYFKWDFLAAPNSVGPAAAATTGGGGGGGHSSSSRSSLFPSQSMSLTNPNEQQQPKSRSMSGIGGSLSRAFGKTMSRATVKGISVSASGGLFLHERPLFDGGEQEKEKEDKDAHLAAIKEVWRTFNVSDEVVELEEKGSTSQVFA
jgi:hypothetical protein